MKKNSFGGEVSGVLQSVCLCLLVCLSDCSHVLVCAPDDENISFWSEWMLAINPDPKIFTMLTLEGYWNISICNTCVPSFGTTLYAFIIILVAKNLSKQLKLEFLISHRRIEYLFIVPPFVLVVKFSLKSIGCLCVCKQSEYLPSWIFRIRLLARKQRWRLERTAFTPSMNMLWDQMSRMKWDKIWDVFIL